MNFFSDLRKIDEILVIAEIVKNFVVRFRFAIADGRNRESIEKVELTLFAVCEANEFRCGAHSNNNINYSVPSVPRT